MNNPFNKAVAFFRRSQAQAGANAFLIRAVALLVGFIIILIIDFTYLSRQPVLAGYSTAVQVEPAFILLTPITLYWRFGYITCSVVFMFWALIVFLPYTQGLKSDIWKTYWKRIAWFIPAYLSIPFLMLLGSRFWEWLAGKDWMPDWIKVIVTSFGVKLVVFLNASAEKSLVTIDGSLSSIVGLLLGLALVCWVIRK